MYKEKSTEKIDGAVVTIKVLDRAIRCGNDNGASVYDSRGCCSFNSAKSVEFKKFLHYSAFTRFSSRFML